jgi:hypothetical protein
MARVTEVTVSRSCRINLGNYEGLEHFISMKAEVDEGEDPKKVQAMLAATVERQMLTQLKRSYKIRKKKVTDEQIAFQTGLSYPLKESS